MQTTAKAIGTLFPTFNTATTVRKPFDVLTMIEGENSFTGTDAQGNHYDALKVYWRFVPAQETAVWDGEGLPPVGSFVEARSIEEVDRCDLNFDEHCIVDTWKNGEELEVIAHKTVHGVDCVIVFNVKKMQASAIMADYCRPIRTPEQIAAEEKNKILEEMVSTMNAGTKNGKTHAHALYDAGYRKQVAP